ncbi:MAG: 50S ribosomal protein L21 [Candidatus Gracilibacteria bacterium]|jgi:large subunit ribosomal protein L21
MFAIIEIGGQQFKVEKGTILEVGRLQEKEGNTIEINKVLLLNDGGKITVGTPFIVGAFASAKLLEHKKDKKVITYKMKAKKRYRRTIGHRQSITKLEITDVKTTGGKAPEKKAVKAVAVAPINKKNPTAKKVAKPKTEAKKPAVKKAAAKKPAAKKTTKKVA